MEDRFIFSLKKGFKSFDGNENRENVSQNFQNESKKYNNPIEREKEMLIKSNQRLIDIKEQYLKLKATYDELKKHHIEYDLHIKREMRNETKRMQEIQDEISKFDINIPQQVNSSVQIIEQIWLMMNEYRKEILESE